MSTQATYDDANLILRLFELRREERLREARDWFARNFTATTVEELQKVAPPASKENAHLRMVVSYWEMAASFVTSGVLNQDLFFESNGEMLGVWERLRGLVPGMREFTKNPHMFRNLEIVGEAYVKWFASHGPEAYPTFQTMMKTLAAGARS